MAGIIALPKLSCITLALLLSLMFESGFANYKSISKSKPCKHMVLYYHDTLFNGTNAGNATAAVVANATAISDTWFGKSVVFDDPMTIDSDVNSPAVARAQGFYFYDLKDTFGAWFAYSLVFDSSEYKGTINLMGADLLKQKTRDVSVVGGTGDFFMARGIATLSTDYASPDLLYFRLRMDIKLYECY